MWITHAFVLFLVCVAIAPLLLLVESAAHFTRRKLPVTYYRFRMGYFCLGGLALVVALLGAALTGGRTVDWVLLIALVVFLGGMLALRFRWWRQERRERQGRSPLLADSTPSPPGSST